MTLSVIGPAMIPMHRCKYIHLIRHGQGFHNVAGENNYGAYMSDEFEDACLTPTGWQQAFALREHIAAIPGGLKIELVVTSPLMRTLQTSAGVFGSTLLGDKEDGPLIMAHGAGKSDVGIISGVGSPPLLAVEMCREHLGQHPCDKRSPVTLYKKQFPAIDFSLIESDKDEWWLPDVRESTADLTERGRKFTKWLMTRPEMHIAVVSHSSFLIHFLSQFGADCGQEVKDEIRVGYNNCEMRSLVLMDKAGETISPDPARKSLNFKGGKIGSTSSDEADEVLQTKAEANGNV